MNIFTDKMANKSTNELVDILNQKDKFQKDAIIAVVEELKKRDYKEQELDEKSIGIKLKEDPESLFKKLKPFGYQVEKLEESLIIIEREKLFNKYTYQFDKEKVQIKKRTRFKEEITEINRVNVKDIIVEIDPNNSYIAQRTIMRHYPMCISLITKDGDFFQLIMVSSLNAYVDDMEEYLEKVIKVLKMN